MLFTCVGGGRSDLLGGKGCVCGGSGVSRQLVSGVRVQRHR